MRALYIPLKGRISLPDDKQFKNKYTARKNLLKCLFQQKFHICI